MAGRKRRTAPIKIAEPGVVPMSAEDHEQAVTALATMIADWWEREQRATNDERSDQPDGE
jgi:hypothetical protein